MTYGDPPRQHPVIVPGRFRLLCRRCDTAWSSHTPTAACEWCGQECGVASHDDLFRPVVSKQPKLPDTEYSYRWGGASG